jgi:DNA modification methylase
MATMRLAIDRILQGDCTRVLMTLPEKSIDVIFADPPYYLQLEKQLWRPNATRVNGVQDSWDQFSDFDTYDRFTQHWLLGCRRVLKDNGTIWVIGSYHNIFRVGRIMQDLEFWILNDIIWIKSNPMPNFHGVRFTNAHETLIWAQKIKGNPYTFNYQMMKAINRDSDKKTSVQMRSDWKLPLCTGKERLKTNGEKAHPTQKPEALLERVILSSTKPGDIILDPFFGTGTTGAVAKKLARHWIGIEAQSGYISIAQKRIDSTVQGQNFTAASQSFEHAKVYRIPFVSLVQKGFLEEGQALYFGQNGDMQSVILSDGRIRCGEYIGSIHKVGRQILKAPCNGWQAWYYDNKNTGEREPIDTLRRKLREEGFLIGNNDANLTGGR